MIQNMAFPDREISSVRPWATTGTLIRSESHTWLRAYIRTELNHRTCYEYNTCNEANDSLPPAMRMTMDRFALTSVT